MEYLVWIGAAISLIGLAGLVWCIVIVARAKRAQLSDEDMRNRLKQVVPLNLGALFLSVIGLMLVVVGVLLG
jgi:heme exporter protein D